MRLRAVVKSAIATAVHGTGTAHLVSRDRSRQPLILAYHRIVEEFADSSRSVLPAMLTTTRTFERQLDWLERRFELVDLRDLGGRARSRRPRAAITFDDGYRDVYDNACPPLLRRGIPAAIFVATRMIGSRRSYPHDRLYALLCRVRARVRDPVRTLACRLGAAGSENGLARSLAGAATDPVRGTPVLLERLDRARLGLLMDVLEALVEPPPAGAELETMSWAMLRELARAGFVIGSHTRHHALLPLEDDATARAETAGSRRDLERALGTPVTHFAYPAGCFDQRSVRAVAEAGYARAYTVCTHRDPARPELTLPRKVFWENTSLDAAGRFSPSMMSCQVHRVFDRARCAHG